VLLSKLRRCGRGGANVPRPKFGISRELGGTGFRELGELSQTLRQLACEPTQ